MKQWLRALGIGQIVAVGFGLILLLALAIGLVGRIAYDISQWQRDIIRTRGDVERLTLQLELISTQRTESLRRYLDSADVNFLAAYQTRQSTYSDTFAQIEILLATPQEIAALQAVEIAEAQLNDKAQEVLDLYNDGFPASARFLWSNEGVAAQDNLLQALDRLRQAQGNASRAVISRANRTENLAVIAITIFIFLMLSGGVVASWLITRNIARPISSLVKSVDDIGADLSARVKPSGPKEISFLGESINRMAVHLQASNRSLQDYKDRLEKELTLASQIQATFLPATLPPTPHLELAVFWRSAREVGGDFYAYVELENGKRGIAVGDVSGKGAPAAMAGALAVGLLEAHAPLHFNPQSLLSELNKDLCSRLSARHMNVACCYAIIDNATSCITVANAGCMYPYLRRDNTIHEIPARGLPLGAWPDFDYMALSLPLQRGDLIIFSSDGLVEAQNSQGDLLGFERLQAELMSLPPHVDAQAAVNHLVNLALDFTGSGDLHDDITVLVARVI